MLEVSDGKVVMVNCTREEWRAWHDRAYDIWCPRAFDSQRTLVDWSPL